MGSIKSWNGSSWVDERPMKWNGSAWVTIPVYKWNGSSWVNIATQQYVTGYTGTWGQSYQGGLVGGAPQRTDNTHLYQGYYDSSRGIHSSLIGYDYATIQSNLSGATVDAMNIFLNNWHSYYADYMYLGIGMHNNTSKPATLNNVYSWNERGTNASKGVAYYETLQTFFGERIRDNVCKGIAFGVNTTDQRMYGYFVGFNDTYTPTGALSITYTK